jgi:hypothetical protein
MKNQSNDAPKAPSGTYEPPAVHDLGRLRDLTRSHNTNPPGDQGNNNMSL